MICLPFRSSFFFNSPATTEIYTLSLHDALPICKELLTAIVARVRTRRNRRDCQISGARRTARHRKSGSQDRKSTRLNSSHSQISYAVFCLKKKKKPRLTYKTY